MEQVLRLAADRGVLRVGIPLTQAPAYDRHVAFHEADLFLARLAQGRIHQSFTDHLEAHLGEYFEAPEVLSLATQLWYDRPTGQVGAFWDLYELDPNGAREQLDQETLDATMARFLRHWDCEAPKAVDWRGPPEARSSITPDQRWLFNSPTSLQEMFVVRERELIAVVTRHPLRTPRSWPLIESLGDNAIEQLPPAAFDDYRPSPRTEKFRKKHDKDRKRGVFAAYQEHQERLSSLFNRGD